MTVWKDDGTVKIWTRQDTAADGSTSITACSEMLKMDAKPEEFVPYFKDWAGQVCEVNCPPPGAAFLVLARERASERGSARRGRTSVGTKQARRQPPKYLKVANTSHEILLEYL